MNKTTLHTIACTIVMLIVMPGQSFAQDCYDAFSKAKSNFDNGSIEECVEILEPCLESIKDIEEEFEAYKLLALAFQSMHDFDEMEYYMWKMLKLKPDYRDFPNNDPAEFTKVLNSLEVKKTWQAGICVGSNVSSIQLLQSYSALNYPQRYSPTLGYQVGIFGDYNWKQNVQLEGQILVMGTSIDHKIYQEGLWSIDFHEAYRYVQLNSIARRSFPVNRKFELYGGLGPGLSILIYSSAFYEYQTEDRSVLDQESSNTIKSRVKLAPTAQICTGIGWYLDRGKVDLELFYMQFLRKTVTDSKRYKDEDFIFRTQYVNDDLLFFQAGLNVKYSVPIKYHVSR